MNLNQYSGLAPEDAVNFFKDKGYKIGFDYRDVWNKEHQTAFTVAKGMQLSILDTLKTGIDRAIKDGVPFAEFQKSIKPALIAQGWWGKVPMTDPKTGETKIIDISASRLKKIYDTNLRTSHSEGQWQRILDTKDMLPYLIFQGCLSSRSRPEHCALTGSTYPVDDAVWGYLMPPLAFNCKCRVRQVLKPDKVSEPLDTKEVTHTNERTGEKTTLHEIKSMVINPVTNKKELVTWTNDPAFAYAKGSYQQHITKHVKAEGRDMPYTKKALDVQDNLSKVSIEYKSVRLAWPAMTDAMKIKSIDEIARDVVKIKGFNAQQSTFLAIAMDSEIDIAERLVNLGYLVAMLGAMPT